MSLESATYIDGLVATNPTSSDAKSQGDDHLRLLKSTIKTTFPNVAGAVTPTHTELNFVDGVTSAIQGQIDSKGAIAGQTWSGTHTFPAAVAIGNVSAAEIAYLDGVTSAVQAQIDSKGAITGQTWAGTHTFPSTISFGNVSATEISYLDGLTSAIQTQINGKATASGQIWTGSHDYTGATVTVAAPTVGANPVTKTYADNLAFAAALPGQAGNSGKFVTTDGTAASWAEVYPSQTGNSGKFLSTNGTATSWVTSGISSVTNIVSATTLTAANLAYHTVAMTALGVSVTLPDATTLTVGTPRAVFKNTGGYPFGIRDSAGVLIMGVAAGGVAYVSLDSASTAAGSWSVTGSNLEPGLTTIDTTFSSTYASTVLAPFVALDDNVSIHFAALASGFAAFVVDKVGGVVSTPVTVSATASSVPVQCFKVSSTSAILFFGESASANRVVVLTLTGSTPSYSLSVGTALLVLAGLNSIWSGENFVGAPKIIQLSGSLYLVSYTASANTGVIALSVSGSTVTSGANVNIITSSTVADSTTTYALTATTALVLYKSGGAAPYANNAVVISVSGTTCTVGTPAAVSSVNSSLTSAPISCLLSATKCLVADDNNTTVGNVNVVTISGTTVTAGTVVQFESGLTWTSGYTANSATRYNPHLFPLTTSTALLWYFDSSSVSRCVVLSESGGTVTKGTIVYRSISKSGGGAGIPLNFNSATSFMAACNAGVNPSLYAISASAISGTTISTGPTVSLSDFSLSTAGHALLSPQVSLSSGDSLFMPSPFSINGGTNSNAGIAVLRTNGDAINYRGRISTFDWEGAGSDLISLPSPVAANRVVYMQKASASALGPTTYQLRLLNIEIAQ